MRKRWLYVPLLGLTTAVLVMAAPMPVLAHEDGDDDKSSTTTSESVRQKATERLEDAKTKLQTMGAERLEGAKKQVCERRTKNITEIMKRSIARSENHINLFNIITARVEAFYQKKGNPLTNYDELVAQVESAKTEAQTSLEALKNAAAVFSCDSEHPLDDITAFKAANQTLHQDLKDYRTAVKNLVAGVKSVQPDKRSQQ